MSQDPMPPAPEPVPALPSPTPAPPGVPHMARTSGLAAASLILGILGFLSCGLTGLVGLVFGVVALMAISKSAGRLRGQGMAVAGLVLSAVSTVSLVFYGVVAAVVLPTIALAAEEDLTDESVARLRAVASNTELYGIGHGGALPPAHNWVAAVGLDEWLLAFPDDPDQRPAFAMNARLDGRTVRELPDAANTVLYFEASPGGPRAGGPELLPLQPRYKGYLIVYANGDLGMVPRHELTTLIWTP